jgi:hypothetical protein
VRRGWKWASRNLAVSVNIRACSMGVYARRSFWEEEGMKERVSMRQACTVTQSVYILLRCEIRGKGRATNSDWSTMGATTNFGLPILS